MELIDKITELEINSGEYIYIIKYNKNYAAKSEFCYYYDSLEYSGLNVKDRIKKTIDMMENKDSIKVFVKGNIKEEKVNINKIDNEVKEILKKDKSNKADIQLDIKQVNADIEKFFGDSIFKSQNMVNQKLDDIISLQDIKSLSDEQLMSLIKECKFRDAKEGLIFKELMKEKALNVETFEDLEKEASNRGYYRASSYVKEIKFIVDSDVAMRWEMFKNGVLREDKTPLSIKQISKFLDEAMTHSYLWK